MGSHEAVELVGHAHHGNQQQQLDADADPDVLPVDVGEHQAGHQNGHHDHHKQKAGAAAGMVLGLGTDVLHRQGQARLIAENGLMLRAVVAEHAVNVLLLGAEDQIAQENGHLHHALDDVVDRGALSVKQPGDECRQQHEQHQCQGQAQNHGERHHQGLQFLCGDVLFQPLVEFAGLGVLLIREIVRRKHQRLDAGDHGADERHGAAEDRHAQNGVLAPDELPLCDLSDQSLWRADHDGVLLRSAHEDTFDQRLPADSGAERALFLFHMPE